MSMIALAFTLTACAGTRELVTTKENPACDTTIEGNYYNEEFWTGKIPALVTKKNGELIVWEGAIVSIDDKGIRFDPRRESPFYDPPEKLYTFDEIVCAVDERRKTVYGTVPEKNRKVWLLELQVASASQPDARSFKICLVPNEKFSYCLAPDEYVLKKIQFKMGADFIDEAVNFPKLSFRVAAGMANYLGDLYLDYDQPDQPGVFVLPFRIKSRPNQFGAMQFGLIGALLYQASLPYKTGIHTLRVKSKDSFSSATGLTVRPSPLQGSARRPQTKSPNRN
ncbi:MAG: hypothetical protein ACREOO_26460 [bacterium]